MGNSFSLTPTDTPIVLTRHRAVVAPVPHPDSLPVMAKIQQWGVPADSKKTVPLVWDCAEDFFVYDNYGNRWIDCGRTGLTANAGHGIPEVRESIIYQIQRGLLYHGLYPSEEQADLLDLLSSLAPDGLDKAQLFSSDGDAARASLDLCRASAIHAKGEAKRWIIGFTGWENAPQFDSYYTSVTCDESLQGQLQRAEINPYDVAALIVDSTMMRQSVQSGYELMAWCKQHHIMIVCDETSTGLGRTGKLWAFEHLGIQPDLICCGSNLTSSVPMGALVGRSHLWSSVGKNRSFSASCCNPLASAAALASLKFIIEKQLIENAENMGVLLRRELEHVMHLHGDHLTNLQVSGLYASMEITGHGSISNAHLIVEKCFLKGVLIDLNDRHDGQGCELRITPPLSITAAALMEAIHALSEALNETFNISAGRISVSEMMEAVS